MEKVRTFVAVPVTGEVERAVEQVETALKRSRADVKWVRPDNVHVTLKFLGGVEAERLEEISGALRGALAGARAFDALVAGVGTFPHNPLRARVIFMDLKEGAEGMKELARRVEDALSEMGFEREARPFRCHLTIGRVRREARSLAGLPGAIERAEYNPLKLPVYRVNLVKSKLTPSGAVYEVLDTFDLER